VVLTIVPLLSLGADQTAKLQSLSDVNQLPVQLYHLDEYRDAGANRSLCRLITNKLTDDTVTLFLFSSPQKVRSREWSDCLASLIKRQAVPFTLCVDECHLYAQFGAEF
jgi:superfamily II DNA helicase RecQ